MTNFMMKLLSRKLIYTIVDVNAIDRHVQV